MAFRCICLAAIAAVSTHAGVISSVKYSEQPAVLPAYQTVHAPSFLKTVHTGPAVATTDHHLEAPAVVHSVQPAALLKTVNVASPVAPAVKTHTIETQAARSHIRVEEYEQGPQVVRVHEQPAAPPEVVRVQAPSEPPSLIRVINKAAPPATVERVVHRNPEAHVVDIQKPAPPPARIVQVVRSPAPLPRIEFYNEPSEASVHHLETESATFSAAHVPTAVATHVQHGPSVTYAAAPSVVKTVHPSVPTLTTAYHHAPAAAGVTYAAVPAVVKTSVHAGPAVSTTYHAPAAVAYGHGPVSTSYHTPAYVAPGVSSYGGYAYNSDTVVLDSHKKAKSA